PDPRPPGGRMMALSLGGMKVLIVEDNFVVADALRFLIDGYGGAGGGLLPAPPRAPAGVAPRPGGRPRLGPHPHPPRRGSPPGAPAQRSALPWGSRGARGGGGRPRGPRGGNPGSEKRVGAERLVRAMIPRPGGPADPWPPAAPDPPGPRPRQAIMLVFTPSR